MTRNAAKVLEEALTLSDADRADLVGALLTSLEPEEEAEVEASWRSEVAARVAAYEAGEAQTIPWEQVRSRLAKKLGE